MKIVEINDMPEGPGGNREMKSKYFGLIGWLIWNLRAIPLRVAWYLEKRGWLLRYDTTEEEIAGRMIKEWWNYHRPDYYGPEGLSPSDESIVDLFLCWLDQEEEA